MKKSKDTVAYLTEDNWLHLKGLNLNVWRHLGHSVGMHLELRAVNRDSNEDRDADF